ncbi:MAG: SurA N-terminal domain-containing protein, partial [Fimbriimonadaceae bacterium]
MKSSIYVALTAAAAITVAGCGGKSEDVVAVVNGERITTSQFYDYLERKPTVRVQTDNGPVELPVADTIAFQAIQDLIARRLILQLAK